MAGTWKAMVPEPVWAMAGTWEAMVRVPAGINRYMKNGVDSGSTPFFCLTQSLNRITLAPLMCIKSSRISLKLRHRILKLIIFPFNDRRVMNT